MFCNCLQSTIFVFDEIYLLNLQGVVILVHMSFLQLKYRICDLTLAMIDKTLSGFKLCHQSS